MIGYERSIKGSYSKAKGLSDFHHLAIHVKHFAARTRQLLPVNRVLFVCILFHTSLPTGIRVVVLQFWVTRSLDSYLEVFVFQQTVLPDGGDAVLK